MRSPRWPAARARSTASRRTRERARVLGADEDEARVRADGVAGERHALEQQLGVALHQQLVDVRARVALVAVDHDHPVGVARLCGELPLGAGREAGAAAAAHVGLLHLGQQLLGRHARERATQALEAAAREQHGLVEHAPAGGLAGWHGGVRGHTLGHAGAGVDHVAVADRRRRVAEAEADRGAQRAPRRRPSARPAPGRAAPPRLTWAPKSDAQHAVPVQTDTWRRPRGWARSS